MADISFEKVGDATAVRWTYNRESTHKSFWPAIFAFGDIPAGAGGMYRVNVTVLEGGRVDIANNRPINVAPGGAGWTLFSEESPFLQDEIRARSAGGRAPFPLHATWSFAESGRIIGANAKTASFLIAVTSDP